MANPPVNVSKRKEAEKVLYDVMNILDPSGENTEFYRQMFATMSDTKWKEHMEHMFSDENQNWILHIEDFKRGISIESSEKALDYLGVPSEEYLIIPFANMDTENPIVTKYKMITGYDIEFRLQQTVHKKNSGSVHISSRSATTGQVVGDDKNGRSSDQENIALINLGAYNIVSEMNGFRSDGLARKNEAYSDISKTGTCSLKKVESNHGMEDRTSLNTIDVFYKCMGIHTDLISKDLLLPSTMKKGGASDE